MFLPKIPYKDYYRTPTEPEITSEKKQTNELPREDRSVNCVPKNGFFKGLLIALPISILIWAIIVVGIKAFFY